MLAYLALSVVLSVTLAICISKQYENSQFSECK